MITPSPINTVILALIAACTGILSPVLMAWLTNRNTRRVKADDYARQDLVAERALAAATALQESQDRLAIKADQTAALLVKSNRKIVDLAQVQTAKIDQIHTLVNSNLTASMQDQLESQKAYCQLLIEVTDGKQSQGLKASKESLGLIDATKIKIAELEKEIADRLKATAAASAQLMVDISKQQDPEVKQGE